MRPVSPSPPGPWLLARRVLGGAGGHLPEISVPAHEHSSGSPTAIAVMPSSSSGATTTSSTIVKTLLYFAFAFLLASAAGLYYLSHEASRPSLHDSRLLYRVTVAMTISSIVHISCTSALARSTTQLMITVCTAQALFDEEKERRGHLVTRPR